MSDRPSKNTDITGTDHGSQEFIVSGMSQGNNDVIVLQSFKVEHEDKNGAEWKLNGRTTRTEVESFGRNDY
jgi:hypothetical protein